MMLRKAKIEISKVQKKETTQSTLPKKWLEHVPIPWYVHLQCYNATSASQCIYIQMTLVMTPSNITWYCLQHSIDNRRTLVGFWTHKRHPIACPYGQAMGCLMWVILGKWLWNNESSLHYYTYIWQQDKSCPINSTLLVVMCWDGAVLQPWIILECRDVWIELGFIWHYCWLLCTWGLLRRLQITLD